MRIRIIRAYLAAIFALSLLIGCGQSLTKSEHDTMQERAESKKQELHDPEDCVGMNLAELDENYKVHVQLKVPIKSFSDYFEKLKTYSGEAVIKYAFEEKEQGKMTMRRNKAFKAKVVSGKIEKILEQRGYPEMPWPEGETE